ncbi:MAG: DMT family transporter [Gammaproteobacteria bacterium]
MSNDTRGIVYMLLASFFFALMALGVKLVQDIPVLEIIFFRAVIAIALCLWGLWRAGIAPLGTPANRRLLLFRGIAGAVSLAQGFYLIQTIPLAAASTLTHLSPIFTTLIAVWFVNEKVAPQQLVFFVLSFAGVVMIQGFDYRISLWHLAVGISASFCMGLAYNSVRRLGGDEHPLVIMFYFPLVCLPFGALYSYFYWVQPQGWEWASLLLIGVTAQLGQYFMTRSYQVASVARVAIVAYSEVIFAIVLGFVLFAEHFHLLAYAGMALVAAGVIMNMRFKPGSRQAAALPAE